jgi:hypothetical protein
MDRSAMLAQLHKELLQVNRGIQALERLERIEMGKTQKVGRALKADRGHTVQEISFGRRI